MFFIDGHCDTLTKALDLNKGVYENDLQFSIKKANEIGGGIQVLACFVETCFLNPKNINDNLGFNRCNKILEKFETCNLSNILIKNSQDLENAVKSNTTKVILSIENGSAISGDLNNIKYFYDKGVRIMSVTWDDDNDLGCGAKTNFDTGLTFLGVQYIKELEKMGILIDVSHLSEKSFWDVMLNCKSRVVATHSNVYELCKHPRNLKDEQIKAIANRGGVIGICYYSDYLNSKCRADLGDIIEHVKYVRNLVGSEFVSLGSDFDGMGNEDIAVGMENVSKLVNLKSELYKNGFSEEEVENVMWRNWYRVLV